MSKQCIGTRFDTLAHMVVETEVILYVHPLTFLRCFLSLLKFSFIFMNTLMKQFSYRTTG